MSAISTRYHFDESGRWSGGGRAFLNNAAHAAARHKILSGDQASIPIVSRNFPQPQLIHSGRFVIVPQNAWPWYPVARTGNELARVAALRAASVISMHRALAVGRISSAIPAWNSRITFSPIIHNVLDTEFEKTVARLSGKARAEAAGSFVYIGSSHAYKNVDRLALAYRLYREGGGTRGLFLAGPLSSAKSVSRIAAMLERVPGVTISFGDSLSRADALASMRDAHAVILPSIAEASPLTALEAAWANPHVVMSDIPGHREIFGFDHTPPHDAFFNVRDAGSLAQRLWSVENSPLTEIHSALSSAAYRERARIAWGNSIAEWISSI